MTPPVKEDVGFFGDDVLGEFIQIRKLIRVRAGFCFNFVYTAIVKIIPTICLLVEAFRGVVAGEEAADLVDHSKQIIYRTILLP